VIVVDVVLPAMPPGLIVQLPAGSPLSCTLPVATAQVGWVIVPTPGAVGGAGGGLIVTEVAADIHPATFFTVTLYVPGTTLLNTPVVLV
jgi:hypothetical protein